MRIGSRGSMLRDALVRALPGRRVVQIDTRMSQVLLTGPYAIKLRRPVGALASAQARREAMEREQLCNGRISPAVYRGVYPVPTPPGSEPPMQGWPVAPSGDEPADWALVMHRLPAARLLDRAIRSGTVCAQDIDRLACRLAAFYRAAPAESREVGAHLARIDREQARNRVELPALGDRLWRGRPSAIRALDSLIERCDAAWRVQQVQVAARVRAGCVIEAHGDLRPEHICLTDPIELIDCLEFDRQLRLLDPWEELCLLGLLCAFAGAAWIGPRLAYRLTEDGEIEPPSPGLLEFYCAHHALVRARLAASHLAEPHPRRARHWRAFTRRYLGYAEAACAGWQPLGEACPPR